MNININGQAWTVEQVESHDSNLIVDGDVCLGSCWPTKMTIYISRELNISRALRTMRHELTHAYIAATQLGTPTEWTEEHVCEMVALYGPSIQNQAIQIIGKLYGEAPKDEA